jgi:hypothetical protein
MRRSKFRVRQAPWLAAGLMAMGPSVGWAIQLPTQVTPYAPEPGAPLILNQGTGSTQSAPSGGSATGGGVVGGSDALNVMEGQSWGQQAELAAQALGLNPSALAATCVIESGCNSSAVNGSAVGAFQMQPAAFQDGLNTALAADPALASEVVQGAAGMNDPVTEAIAASGYLMQANQALETQGVASPTVLDARAYYNFGPSTGSAIASAAPTDLMSSYLSPTVMARNNISATETVAQWQASVSATIGNSAQQLVMG